MNLFEMECHTHMNYHHIKQHDITDCGVACIATISKQHGLKIPISKIREVAERINKEKML